MRNVRTVPIAKGHIWLAALLGLSLVVAPGCGGEGGGSTDGGASGSATTGKLPKLDPAVIEELGGRLQMTYAALQKGDANLATDYLRLALQKAPDGPVLYYHLAVAQAQAQRPDSALAALEKAIDLGLNDLVMVERDEALSTVRALPQWPALRGRIEARAQERRVDQTAYERLDPKGEPDFAQMDSLLKHYQDQIMPLTVLMMVYPSDRVFPEIWPVLNHKMAALEKYIAGIDRQIAVEGLAEAERTRLQNEHRAVAFEMIKTAGSYESPNRTPWLPSTLRIIEEKVTAFLEKNPEESRAGAQAFYLLQRAKWFAMMPSDPKAADAATRQKGVELLREVDARYEGTSAGLLALLDAMELITAESGLSNPELIPLVDRVRTAYDGNPVMRQFSHRLQPFALGAHGMPEFTVVDLDGKSWNSVKLGRKAVLVDFWATWCAPCRRELPNLVELYTQYKDRGFEILGISVDDPSKTSDEQLRAWAQQNNLTWPLVYDKKYWDSPAVKACNVTGIPFPILVDENGRVVAAGQGATGGQLREALARIFG